MLQKYPTEQGERERQIPRASDVSKNVLSANWRVSSRRTKKEGTRTTNTKKGQTYIKKRTKETKRQTNIKTRTNERKRPTRQ